MATSSPEVTPLVTLQTKCIQHQQIFPAGSSGLLIGLESMFHQQYPYFPRATHTLGIILFFISVCSHHGVMKHHYPPLTSKTEAGGDSRMQAILGLFKVPRSSKNHGFKNSYFL